MSLVSPLIPWTRTHPIALSLIGLIIFVSLGVAIRLLLR
jgi:hypothetical protein